MIPKIFDGNKSIIIMFPINDYLDLDFELTDQFLNINVGFAIMCIAFLYILIKVSII